MAVNVDSFGVSGRGGGGTVEDSRVEALETRMSTAETNIQTIIEGGTPVQGSFTCGDWDDGQVIIFAAWTAA